MTHQKEKVAEILEKDDELTGRKLQLSKRAECKWRCDDYFRWRRTRTRHENWKWKTNSYWESYIHGPRWRNSHNCNNRRWWHNIHILLLKFQHANFPTVARSALVKIQIPYDRSMTIILQYLLNTMWTSSSGQTNSTNWMSGPVSMWNIIPATLPRHHHVHPKMMNRYDSGTRYIRTWLLREWIGRILSCAI